MGKMRKHKQEILKKQVILAILSVALSSTALALPQNGQVTAGNGTIAQNGNTMNINQTTQNMGMNWNSYNIAKNETVNYHQPNADSVALNRVTGNNPSSIYGSLNANGKVFLINPNGVMFARGASVNVGGIVASTKNITDANFMAGKYNFTGSSDAKVINQGNINVTEGGYVAFLANNVSNEGNIVAPKGSVALAGGNAFTLSTDGTGKINLSVDEAAVNAAAVNSGNIKADGGYVVLKAADAATVVNTVVANTGIIQAHSLKNNKGEIVLEGGSQGIVNAGGTMDASAAEANTTGGNITVKGLYTNVNKGAQLMAKATGTATGGTIETSGDYLYVDKDATINASSEQGLGGTWSLDPLNVKIGTTGSAWTGTYNNADNASTTSEVLASSVAASLNNGTSVSIEATDKNKVADITVASAIEKTAGGEATLTLKAQRNVTVNAPISSTAGKLNMTFWSDTSDTAGDVAGAVVLNADLNSNGGNIIAGSGATLTNGTVGAYVGLTTDEFNTLISAIGSGDINDPAKPKRTFTTNGGNFNVYGDLLLATGSEVTIDTINNTAGHTGEGGNVSVSGKIDSGNFYKMYTFSADDIQNTKYYWTHARTDAYTNSFGTHTEGGSLLLDSYLTNITSVLENSIVLSTFTKTTRLDAYYIGAHADDVNNVLVAQPGHNRTWYWTDGPEAGKTFFKETASGVGSSVGMDYSYSSWHSGEPNNAQGTWAQGQNVATVGYDWSSKWDDNGATNKLNTDGSLEIKGYIQETNNLRSALVVNAAAGNVELGGDIGSQRTLWALNVNNTGNVTTKGTVQLSGDLFNGVQYGGDMNIESTGAVRMEKSVSATGHIYIGQTVAPASVTALSTLTAGGDSTVRNTADRNILIGTDSSRAGSVSLTGAATADDGIKIYTAGDVTAGDLTAKGLVTAGNIVINDSGAESKITLTGTTTTTSTADDRDDITLYGDKMDLQGAVTTNGNTGVVTVSNYTPGNNIDLGSAVDTTANTLEISSTEVNKITASKLVVGNNTATTATKNIKVTAGIAPTGTSVVHMYTGQDGTIAETGTGTLTPGLNSTLNLAVTAAGSVNLDNANNITTFAAVSDNAATGTIRLNQGSNKLTIGTVDGVTGVTTNVANPANYTGVVLATTGSFVNKVGANGVQTTGANSYWRVFSNKPEEDTFGPGDGNTYLKSNSYADWSTTYAKGDTVGKKGGITANTDDAYNHYIFIVTPTLVITPYNQTKEYGTDLTSNTDYTAGVEGTNYGIIGDVYDSAYLMTTDIDTVKAQISNVVLSSTGYAGDADVGTYTGATDGILAAVTGITDGSTTTNGYIIKIVPGTVTVTPKALTIHLSETRTYGDTKTGNTFGDAGNNNYTVDNGDTAELNGLLSGDKTAYNAAIYNALANFYDNTDEKLSAKNSYTSNNGTYLTLSSTALTNAASVLKNYTVTYADTYTVNPAALTINLTGSREYGADKSGNTFPSADYTVDNGTKAKTQGLKAWDADAYNSLITNTSLNDKTLSTKGQGHYTSTPAAGVDTTYLTISDTAKASAFLQNYKVTYKDTYDISKAALDITVEGNRKYGETSSTDISKYTVTTGTKQLKNGETINNSSISLTNNIAANSNVGDYYKNYTGKTNTTPNISAAPVLAGLSGDNGFVADNYTITYHTKYTITPADLTLTVSGTREYGDANPSAESYVLSGSGWKFTGDTDILTNNLGTWQQLVTNSTVPTNNAGNYGTAN